ncbi:MAG: hypothetical protein WDO13_15970 [Verrucomicrobiota bacterium]
MQTHPDMAWMTAPISRELQRTGRHVTRTLQQIVTPERFAASEVNKLWRECGFFPRIVSFYPLPDGISSGLGLYRRWDRPPCTEREARIVHVLTSEIAWLHLHESPRDGAGQRAPAARAPAPDAGVPAPGTKPQGDGAGDGDLDQHRLRLRARHLPALRRQLPGPAGQPLLPRGWRRCAR